jgi:hypothetical protein
MEVLQKMGTNSGFSVQERENGPAVLGSPALGGSRSKACRRHSAHTNATDMDPWITDLRKRITKTLTATAWCESATSASR